MLSSCHFDAMSRAYKDCQCPFCYSFLCGSLTRQQNGVVVRLVFRFRRWCVDDRGGAPGVGEKNLEVRKVIPGQYTDLGLLSTRSPIMSHITFISSDHRHLMGDQTDACQANTMTRRGANDVRRWDNTHVEACLHSRCTTLQLFAIVKQKRCGEMHRQNTC